MRQVVLLHDPLVAELAGKYQLEQVTDSRQDSASDIAYYKL